MLDVRHLRNLFIILGLDIIISLVLNEIRPLADTRMDLALEIKGNAAKLLLAILESRHDADNADRILRHKHDILFIVAFQNFNHSITIIINILLFIYYKKKI